MSSDLPVTATVIIPAEELEWTSVRSSGPGGQNVNKVASKVELRFAFENSAALSADVKARLLNAARGRLDAENRIIILSQLTRERARNLEDARDKLAVLVRAALVPPKPRKKTRPSRRAVQRRLTDKRQRATKKQSRTQRADD